MELPKEVKEILIPALTTLVDQTVTAVTTAMNNVPDDMKETCNRCKNELTKPGALLLGPPGANHQVVTYNLCEDCFFLAIDWMS